MKLAILLLDEITVLDAIGPYEVLARLPGIQLQWVAKRKGPIVTDCGLGLIADHALSDVHACDLLLVPGGFGTRFAQNDREVCEWIANIDRTTQITASVCTGSILLGAAGLLRGKRATTHWAFYDQLAAHGAKPISERVVRDGKYATAAGVSAGIDLALTLAIELAGKDIAERIQLSIEYDPAPPIHAGRPDLVAPAVRESLYNRMHARDCEISP